MIKALKKVIKQTAPARIVTFIVFFIYAFTMVYALGWAVLASLKTHIEFMLTPNAMPEKWLFSNYVEAFSVLNASGANMFTMLFNSLWLTLVNSMISVVVSCAVAYVVARFNFVGKKVVLFVQFVLPMVPIYGGGAAGYKLIHQLGLYDNPLFVLKSASAMGMIFFILRSFFLTLPKEYEESAAMDGAGYFKVYAVIMLPMALPAIASIFLMCFIGGWNDYMMPIMYMPSYPTLASGLYIYETLSKFNINMPVYFAGIVICAIPPVILFSISRSKLMTNMSVGGLKG
ncbi:MAG: carbohydrate ABC transporter permease [Clostridiales bacterium]|jgi:ABC-type glycerol-3-phosphate transport system permease component|nr:carbohydrate ABC transporter permease [Clostridiales bacterium]